MLTIAIPKGGLLPEAIALLQTVGLDFSAFLDKKNRQLQITDQVAGVIGCALHRNHRAACSHAPFSTTA